MNEARLIRRQELVVQLDYGQFYLSAADVDPEVVQEVVEQALEAGGIAQSDGVVVVESPLQNNFAMPLAVELWDAAPADDTTQWQEAFEAHLDVGDSGILYESPTIERIDLDVPPGSYHALITGRGFSAIGWPGSVEPGDSWRIRLWPSAEPRRPARLRRYTPPRITHPEPQFRDAGVAAVRRIHRDLDEERPLSGIRGTATAQRRMPGTRRTLYKYFRDPSGWLTQGGGGGGSPGQEGYGLHGWDYCDEGFGDANRIVPCNGVVECGVLEAKTPAYALASWTWLRLPPERLAPHRRDGATRSGPGAADTANDAPFDLDNVAADEETPTTIVRITHDQVPVEWVDDLSAYWRWMLERGDYDFDLSDARRHGYTR